MMASEESSNDKNVSVSVVDEVALKF